MQTEHTGKFRGNPEARSPLQGSVITCFTQLVREKFALQSSTANKDIIPKNAIFAVLLCGGNLSLASCVKHAPLAITEPCRSELAPELFP